MSSHDLTLWGMGTVRNLRAHWMLIEMGLDYEFHAVHPRSGQTYTPEFLKLNPRHKVPVLRHGSLVIAESAAIIQYVSEAFEAPSSIYVPRSPAERVRVAEWCHFIMSEFDAHTLYVIRRHVTFKNLYGDAPVAVQAAREYFYDQLNAIEPRISENGPHLFGDRLSVADILLTTCLDWATEYQFPLPTGVQEYHGRAIRRPAYLAANARTFPNASNAPVASAAPAPDASGNERAAAAPAE